MPLSHAILAFLNYQPMTGYDLKKFFDQSVKHFWSATQSHIYKSLDTLDKEGWATARVIPQDGKPSRREYHITQTGREELRRWLVTPLPMEAVREASLIQIFFSAYQHKRRNCRPAGRSQSANSRAASHSAQRGPNSHQRKRRKNRHGARSTTLADHLGLRNRLLRV